MDKNLTVAILGNLHADARSEFHNILCKFFTSAILNPIIGIINNLTIISELTVLINTSLFRYFKCVLLC